jgi:hypothetical protein
LLRSSSPREASGESERARVCVRRARRPLVASICLATRDARVLQLIVGDPTAVRIHPLPRPMATAGEARSLGRRPRRRRVVARDVGNREAERLLERTLLHGELLAIGAD